MADRIKANQREILLVSARNLVATPGEYAGNTGTDGTFAGSHADCARMPGGFGVSIGVSIGGTSGAGRGRPSAPLGGESLGIPTNIKLQNPTLLSILIPSAPQCEFGPCVDITHGFVTGGGNLPGFGGVDLTLLGSIASFVHKFSAPDMCDVRRTLCKLKTHICMAHAVAAGMIDSLLPIPDLKGNPFDVPILLPIGTPGAGSIMNEDRCRADYIDCLYEADNTDCMGNRMPPGRVELP